ncbi:Calcium-dependent protein kinase 2 [Zea mays]|uniref:non-specific serine/threonine protein kinase n=1 Tax=Zea mays TaxID=4577 RepID=A0A3L6EYQ6_MAIZE|nr:Calcium-dependent protein kinase 2 [Zea mays]
MGQCCSKGQWCSKGAEAAAAAKANAPIRGASASNTDGQRPSSSCAAPGGGGGGGATKPASPTGGARASKPAAAAVGTVLGRPMEDVRATYTMGKELGRGQFGVTHLCTHRASGEKLACKTIAKRKLAGREDVEDVRREVQIMHHLSGQPGVVCLRGAYEDRHGVHLVMELCAGGELFDRIIARGHYTERGAAALLRAIVQTVHTCHSMGVMHRDIKPENFLLLSRDEDAPLKATDFGLSVFFKEGEPLRDIIIAGCLSEEEITGLKEMFKNIDKDNSGTITLDELKQGLAKHGPKLSDSEMEQLMEAADADGNGLIDYDEFVTATVHMNKLDREEHLYTAFQYFDKDNSGYITKEELEHALKEQGLYDADKIKEVIADADSDNDGRIDYSEFVAMMRKGTAGAEPMNNKKRRDIVL